MDIFEIIDNADDNSIYKPLNSHGYMIPLNGRDYDYVYKELRYKNTFHFTDIKGNLNFLIKINLGKDIENIVKNRKILDVTLEDDRPCINLSIEGIENTYSFTFNLNNKNHVVDIKNLLKKRRILLHFIICDGKTCIKDFSALFEVSTIIIDKFKYFLMFNFYKCYPRIDPDINYNQGAEVIVIDGSYKVLDELLNIADKLIKWRSMDKFDVLIEQREAIHIIILGECSNINYIKRELSDKFNVIEESEDTGSGKPFFRYDRGMLYFFKSDI